MPTKAKNEAPTLSNIRKLAEKMEEGEARSLVDGYYQMQEFRKASSNQVKAIEREADQGEPGVLALVLVEVESIERAIRRALDTWTDHDPLSQWAKSIHGIGPVLAAGLAAHIDVRRANTGSKLWRYAGLDPSMQWGKGEKRPYNARMKVLAWKIGDSFVKQSGHPNCFYGHLYAERKVKEITRNEAGGFSETAARTLKDRNIRSKETRKRYEEGMLPDGRIQLRAQRWAVKLFLSHYLEVGRTLLGLPMVAPFPIDHLGHSTKIEPPNFEPHEA